MAIVLRRSRMRRSRTGKRIELSPRDLEIFRLLCRYRYLSSTYICAFVGGASETRLKERLGDLFHEGYIDRPERQWDMPNCRYRPAIYEIGQGALSALREAGVGEEPRTWLGARAHRQFAHSLMICEVLASIELETRILPDLRFIPWSEILAKAPEAARKGPAPFRFSVMVAGAPTAIVPDALFGIEYRDGPQKTYRFFALEADRETMPVSRADTSQSSYMKKLSGYREILARNLPKSQLGLPNLMVLTVSTGERHIKTIKGELASHGDTDRSFLFRSQQRIDQHRSTGRPCERFLREPWSRVGYSDLNLSESE